MRHWQIKKLREAGLDPYMRATWAEAQVEIARARARVQELAAAIDTQQMSAVIDAPPAPKPRAGKIAKPCPYCGVEFKALHWHTPKCKMRPAT